MSPSLPATLCPNLNHRRTDAPVRHCPQCGRTVNAGHPVAACTDDRHSAARRQQNTYCVHCGLRLIAAPPGQRIQENVRRGRDDAW